MATKISAEIFLLVLLSCDACLLAPWVKRDVRGDQLKKEPVLLSGTDKRTLMLSKAMDAISTTGMMFSHHGRHEVQGCTGIRQKRHEKTATCW